MSAAAIEELVDDTTLQDLDFTPPCELPHVHTMRRVPVCPADEVVKVCPPCCPGAEIVLICTGCDMWLETCVALCNTCRRPWKWQQVVVERTPL